MKRRDLLTIFGNTALGSVISKPKEALAAAVKPQVVSRTAALTEAVDILLGSLAREQRGDIVFPFTRPAVATSARFKGGMRGDVDMVGERYGESVWSNYPVSDVPRPGVRLGSLSADQRDKAMGLLRVLLSERGYRKVQQIMGSDQALDDNGTPYASGRDAYTLAIFGEASTTTPWMIQFGGHHLALNVTIEGERGVLAPMLTGALPAIYALDGRIVRALAAENDKAFALLHALDDGQRRQATIEHGVSDLIFGPGHDGETIAPVGLRAAAMNEQLRSMLFDLILEWAGVLNDDYARPRLSEITPALHGADRPRMSPIETVRFTSAFRARNS